MPLKKGSKIRSTFVGKLGSVPRLEGWWDVHLAEPGQHAMGWGVPIWVERDFRSYPRCGILAHGFARLRYTDCGHDRLLAFSCKGRGVCPSCNARRMAEVAAHLTDEVIPHLPPLETAPPGQLLCRGEGACRIASISRAFVPTACDRSASRSTS